MPNFLYIPEDQPEKRGLFLLLCMSLRRGIMKKTVTKDIGLATGIKPYPIRKWLQLWKATGAPMKCPLESRKRASTSIDSASKLTSLEVSVPLVSSRQLVLLP